MSQTIQIKGELQNINHKGKRQSARTGNSNLPSKSFCSDCTGKLSTSHWRNIPITFTFEIKGVSLSMCIRCIRDPIKYFTKTPVSDKELDEFVKPFVEVIERLEKRDRDIIQKKKSVRLNSTTYCKNYHHTKCEGITHRKQPCECHCHEVDFE